MDVFAADRAISNSGKDSADVVCEIGHVRKNSLICSRLRSENPRPSLAVRSLASCLSSSSP
jgi:hypothetical protein